MTRERRGALPHRVTQKVAWPSTSPSSAQVRPSNNEIRRSSGKASCAFIGISACLFRLSAAEVMLADEQVQGAFLPEICGVCNLLMPCRICLSLDLHKTFVDQLFNLHIRLFAAARMLMRIRRNRHSLPARLCLADSVNSPSFQCFRYRLRRPR